MFKVVYVLDSVAAVSRGSHISLHVNSVVEVGENLVELQGRKFMILFNLSNFQYCSTII